MILSLHPNREFPVMTKLLVVGAVLWLSAASQAQHVVPPLVNYQGRLLDSSGTNAANGNYEIAFRIWSAGNAGTLIWGRTYPVTVNSGVFNVVLGEGGSDLPGAQTTDIRQAFTDRERYLGIAVTKDRGVPVNAPLRRDCNTMRRTLGLGHYRFPWDDE